MFNKFLGSAVAVAGLLLTASNAHATATPYSCPVNNASCASTFAAMGNNSATGAAADSVNWSLFATNLHTSQNNGAISNGANQTTPNNDSVTVSNNLSTAFTTYVEGQGIAPSGSGRGATPGQAWDGLFKAGTTVLFTQGNTITLSFATPLIGLGIDAEVFNTGGYTETLQAYNASNQLLTTATQTAVGNGATNGITSAENSAPFVGISTNAQNNASSLASLGISYVTISVACTPVGTNAACSTTGGFAIDTSLIYHYPISNPTTPGSNTPEPGTMSLLGAGLAGLGYFRRRRANKAA